MRYYIVEHATRGCFIERKPDFGLPFKWKYRFSWSILRTDEKVQPFFRLSDAQKIVKEVKDAYVLEIERGPPPKRTITVRKIP